MGWESIASVQAWKSSREFKPRMSIVQQHIDKFSPAEFEVVASIGVPVSRS
jgi:heme-degrading monooxygenase HmoA